MKIDENIIPSVKYKKSIQECKHNEHLRGGSTSKSTWTVCDDCGKALTEEDYKHIETYLCK